MASKFQSCLKRYKPSATIKTIFEVGVKINEELPTPSRQQDVVAIRTACSAKYDSNMLLPDITLPKNHDWSDLVFVALMRLAPAEKRKKYVQVKYAILIGSGFVTAATGAGALVGGIAGGAIGGPLGAGAGVGVGAAVGVSWRCCVWSWSWYLCNDKNDYKDEIEEGLLTSTAHCKTYF